MIILILGLMVLPLVSADVIMPGTKNVQIINKITNIDDFPNYIFISGGLQRLGHMCDPKIVDEEGIIRGGYKFCTISVYAVKKDKVNIENFKEAFLDSLDEAEFEEFWNSLEAKEVISRIEHYKMVSETSTLESIENFYEVDLSEIKTEPDIRKVNKNIIKYLYLLIPLIALVIIIILIIKKYKKK